MEVINKQSRIRVAPEHNLQLKISSTKRASTETPVRLALSNVIQDKLLGYTV